MTVPGTTIDRQCGSSQQAVHLAAQGASLGPTTSSSRAGGGHESGANGHRCDGRTPYGPLAPRFGRLPHQGIGAELIASRWKFSRAELDEYSAQSHQRAALSASTGLFDSEIVPVRLPDCSLHQVDQTVRPGTTSNGLGELQAAFTSEKFAARYPEIEWSIIPGNSSLSPTARAVRAS